MRRYGLVDIPDSAEDIDAVPIGRTLTINGTTYDLSANRTWTISAVNIYNTDGTLTGNRTLTLSTFSLTFAGTTSTRFFANGNVAIGKTTDNGNNLSVLGQADFGNISALTGVVAYRSSVANRLGIFNGPILMSNVADVNLLIDCGGTGLTGNQPVRIYTEPLSGITTQFPLCIQGNGRETIFGQDTITTNATSLVTMVSTTKGFLPPRMTSAQRTAIGSPATGLVVYQTDGSAGLYLRNSGAWVLLGSGTGTVTTVSVVSANGFAGTVANATTTPAITLTTTITGLLKGNGTAISAAVANTDYQQPITLTTTGTSGAATFVGNTLNIPNYGSGTTVTSGTFTPTGSLATNCTIGTIYKAQYLRIGDVITVSGYVLITPSNTTGVYYFDLTIPVNNSLGSNFQWASGVCVIQTDSSIDANSGVVQADSLNSQTNKVQIWMSKANSTSQVQHYYHYTYRMIA
jgi:hypothetical protein